MNNQYFNGLIPPEEVPTAEISDFGVPPKSEIPYPKSITVQDWVFVYESH